ncbi:hypothetical protein IWQ47_002824 [Aquimarina sp. EL_43]|uniref:hypothetical protein n=1 Tax=unclassified Aquimarina TaxID=2627091 RepID=UPI0018CB078D|nr:MULTISPECIES: hypothetical protein [unclassified Aquimarina]MBG6131307.1 hypothetical protein [Aquimarina sp. EL_35]MBG6151810.1 hypothetical protein [Aquimarina sp. EL_32]MBG6169740.1 hypothetical protein [Aquimarina sp. EL_43]
MKTIKIMDIILVLVILGFLSCEKADVIKEDVEQQSLEEDQNVSITLENENKISFFKHEIDEVFILEESNCSNCSVLENIIAITGKELSEAEIFWALSKPEDVVPAFLQMNRVLSKTSSKPQGWARNKVQKYTKGFENPTPSPVIACKNSNFTSAIAGGFLGNPEFVKLDKKPLTYSNFTNDCNNLSDDMCQKGKRYRYSATFNNIKKWRGKICARSVQNSNNDHYLPNIICDSPPCTAYRGPVLYFEFKKDGVWKPIKVSIQQGIEIPANKTKAYSFYKNASKKRSYRIRVKNAMKLDEFDFMMDKAGTDSSGGSTGGGGSTQNEDVIPDYISINDNNRIIVDFTNAPDDTQTPRISIHRDALKSNDSMYHYFDNNGNIILPKNFCGIRVKRAGSFQWQDKNENVVNDSVFNKVGDLNNYGEYNELYALKGIEFIGPLDNCKDTNSNWFFKFPLTHSNSPTVFTEPLKLIIEGVDSGSEIIFLE